MSSSKQTIRSLLTFCTALVVGIALIAAPMTAAAAKTDDQTQMEDSWITAKTKIALFADSRVKGRQINVETKDGLVMIRGKVDTDEAKKAAEEITKLVDGVKSVKNELQVVAPSMREAVEYKDDTITSQVKEDLTKEPRLKGLNIDVKTNAGVVSLSGEVPDLITSADASWTAWKVHGVKYVRNDLTVKEKK
jgi:hyperosmotically inducible periplasmic protein